jgi:hypothetical protein
MSVGYANRRAALWNHTKRCEAGAVNTISYNNSRHEVGQITASEIGNNVCYIISYLIPNQSATFVGFVVGRGSSIFIRLRMVRIPCAGMTTFYEGVKVFLF